MPLRKRADVPDLLRGPTVTIDVRVARDLARALARQQESGPRDVPGILRTPRAQRVRHA